MSELTSHGATVRPVGAIEGSRQSVAVIGAGIVGLCAALFLQRAGLQVTVCDPLPPGSGASFGNAGLISVDSCVPIALPGMLRQVPRWLSDPTGPLAIHPPYLPRALPWLLRWLRAGRIEQVVASSDALRALHAPALDQYRSLLGDALFDDLIRVAGQLHVWENGRESAGERIARQLRERHGIVTQSVGADELQAMVPGIAPRVRHGLFFPRHAHTVNPRRLVQSLAELLLQAGGRLRQEQAMKIVPQPGGAFRLLTNLGDSRFDRVVVAAGAASHRLLRPLGTRIPLETERGYHVELRAPSLDLPIPVVHKDKGFAATPMETGLRLAGTVEIAGLDHPPNQRRADAILRNAQALFPSLRSEEVSTWMGFRPSLPDSVPIIDEVKAHPGLFVACGHGHFGMTAGSMTGRAIAQLVMNAPPPIDLDPYRLSRFH